ncbi:hypothetical protein KY334_04695 [Candidatus Woesearchaeota archaeon]|nr:hypothetical protein [Candidatus Woesearchaeota archaeon]
MSEITEDKINIDPIVDYYISFAKFSVAKGPGACIIYQLKDTGFNTDKEVHSIDLTYCDKGLENVRLMNDLVNFVEEIPSKYKIKQDGIHSRVRIMTYMDDEIANKQISTLVFTTALRNGDINAPYNRGREGLFFMDQLILDSLKIGYSSNNLPSAILSNYNFGNSLELDENRNLYVAQNDNSLEYIIHFVKENSKK